MNIKKIKQLIQEVLNKMKAKMKENDRMRSKKIRLLIFSIDAKKRKYVQIRLKNSDLFNFRSEISNLNENNALEDRISKEKSSVRILSFWSLLSRYEIKSD
jgi:5,10-methylene-tetrahydrofolate dehydrogenase/methenyl tetrahydrofolate cyclohydrolase